MTNKKLPNNKKVLQEQVIRLNNEIEELQLEREESKKNVLFFMQEADSTRQELKRVHQVIDQLTCSSSSKVSFLLSRMNQLDQNQIERLFDLLDHEHLVKQFDQLRTNNLQLQDELDQLHQEYKATRGALQIENERAEIIEKRWKESESCLEQAESTIQFLNKDLHYFRQQQQECSNVVDDSLADELCKLKENYASHLKQIQLQLNEKDLAVVSLQEKNKCLSKQYVCICRVQLIMISNNDSILF
jgi:chromosome segregation ATPase